MKNLWVIYDYSCWQKKLCVFASLRSEKNLWLFVCIRDYSCWKNKLSQDFYRFFLKILARLTEKSYLYTAVRNRHAKRCHQRLSTPFPHCNVKLSAMQSEPLQTLLTARADTATNGIKKRIKSKWSLYGRCNTLYYPTTEGFKVGAYRAYFTLSNGLYDDADGI